MIDPRTWRVSRLAMLARMTAAAAFFAVPLTGLVAAQPDWQLASAPYPRPRTSHAMADDPGRQRVVLFGGESGGVLGDTWEWDGVTWTQQKPLTSPPARSGHAMAYDAARQRVVLFGGFTGYYAPALGDTWEWDGVDWRRLQPPVAPTGRGDHRLVYDPVRQRIVLYGGSTSGTRPTWFNDTWEWDGSTWSKRNPARTPPACADHAMTYDAARNRIVLFGSGGFWNPSNDLWEWDGNNWQPRTPLTQPPARFAHALAYDAATQRVLLFGGFGGSVSSMILLGDTWAWNGQDWKRVTPAMTPPPMAGHAMAFDATRRSVVLCGGYGQRDTWVWQSTNWVHRPRPGVALPRRIGHAIAYDDSRRRTLVFGGRGVVTTTQLFSDMWAWDGARWTPETPATRPPARQFSAMAYDASRGRVVMFGGLAATRLADTWEWDGANWTQMSPTASPPARDGHRMVYDVARRRVVLFGGGTGVRSYLGDTWEWDGATWRQRTSATSPTPRRDFGLAYDRTRRRVVLFGGDTGFGTADTWEWDGTNWTQMSANGASARWNHALAYDEATQRVVLVGGFYYARRPNERPVFHQDTWEWDGQSWWQRTPAHSLPTSFDAIPTTYDRTRGELVSTQLHEQETWTYAPRDSVASTHRVSVATGGRVTLVLTPGLAHAGKAYWVCGCVDTGAKRGIAIGRVTVMLTPDPYFWLTARIPNPLHVNTVGRLDSRGRATATLRVPRLPSTLVGIRFYHAYLLAGTSIDYAGLPVPLTLTP